MHAYQWTAWQRSLPFSISEIVEGAAEQSSSVLRVLPIWATVQAHRLGHSHYPKVLLQETMIDRTWVSGYSADGRIRPQQMFLLHDDLGTFSRSARSRVSEGIRTALNPSLFSTDIIG